MPRPKRSKIAPSAPAQLPESLMKAIRVDAESKRREGQQQRQSSRTKSARAVSESSTQEVFMSGALGLKNASPEVMEEVSAKNTTQRYREESILLGDEPEIVPSSMQSEEARMSHLLPVLTAPSTIQKPIMQRPSMASANWKTQHTPRLDSSILGNFKRRPRQPSILGIGRQDDSSVLSSLSGGDSDPFFDELNDFDPITTTPLIRSKKAVRDQASKAPSSPLASNSRKRKRDSERESEILVQRTPSISTQDASKFFGSSPEQAQEEASDVELPPPKRNVTATSRTSNTSSPKVWSDTMAPPESSPSDRSMDTNLLEAETKQSIPKRKAPVTASKSNPKTRGQKTRALQPITTAQLQNLLPSRRTRQTPNPNHSIQVINTDSGDEDEVSFVPTKRIRASSKQPKTPVKKPTATKPLPKSALRDKINTKSANITDSALRKSKPKPASAIKPRPTAKRYGHGNRVASGQENEGIYSLPSTQDDVENIPSSSIADLDPQAKNELDAIVEKFAEVDEWEMEFEDADGSSGSGSGLLLG